MESPLDTVRNAQWVVDHFFTNEGNDHEMSQDDTNVMYLMEQWFHESRELHHVNELFYFLVDVLNRAIKNNIRHSLGTHDENQPMWARVRIRKNVMSST